MYFWQGYLGIAAEFICLGMLINNDNSIENEIQRCILASNRTYFAATSLFRSQLLTRATKIILYKTQIRLVVSYEVEAWMLTKKEEQGLLIFERKIFRRIYGPKYENCEWKSRTNRELEEMSKGENIVKRAKGKVTWREWTRTGCPKRSPLKNWKGQGKGEDQGKDGKRKEKEIFKCWE